MDDVVERKCNAVGERNRHAKLTEKQVRIIKHSKAKTKVLSKRYRVSCVTIQTIRRGVAWKHIP